MIITVFTSNQPRHISLIEMLVKQGHNVNVVSEVTTYQVGIVSDLFKSSEVMRNYFSKVTKSEKLLFGEPRAFKNLYNHLTIKMGELSTIKLNNMKNILKADKFLVFGASYIKGDLVDFLIENNCLNIHMGLSPYYKGSSCNFWALYDNNPHLVGATVHKISKGLDSGRMIAHAFANPLYRNDPFTFSMSAVYNAFDLILNIIKNKNIKNMKSYEQDRSKLLRYSKKVDFTDKIADEFIHKKIKIPENKILESNRSIFDELIY